MEKGKEKKMEDAILAWAGGKGEEEVKVRGERQFGFGWWMFVCCEGFLIIYLFLISFID